VTAILLLVTIAYTKLQTDHRRSVWVTSDIMADLYNHDFYSRTVAKQAIEKYNRHIEQCNRAIEHAEAGQGRTGWGDAHSDAVKAELQRVGSQLEATAQDRDKLQEELRRKSLVIADLTTRIDALAKKMGGVQGGVEITRVAQASPEASGGDSKLIDQINRLQEELYAERQKNKRLKGA
jgi:chromosome segregation ATPase